MDGEWDMDGWRDRQTESERQTDREREREESECGEGGEGGIEVEWMWLCYMLFPVYYPKDYNCLVGRGVSGWKVRGGWWVNSGKGVGWRERGEW